MMFRSSGLGSDLTSFTDPIPAPAPVVQRPVITMFTDPIPGVSVALPASTPAMMPMTAAELRAWVDDFMLTGFKGNPVPSPQAPNELPMGGSYPFGAAGAVAINAAVWVLLAYGVYRAMSGGRR